MTTLLSHALPDLANILAMALRDKSLVEQAVALETAKIERWTYDSSADAGYIYLVQQQPVRSGETPAAKTVSLVGDEWFNVDLRASGEIFGIELLSHEGIFRQLGSYELG